MSGSANQAPFWAVALITGAFLATVGAGIAAIVLGGARGQARITSDEPACARAVLEGLDSIRRARDLAFEPRGEDAAALIDRGDVVIRYGVDDVHHEAAIRVERSEDGGCSLSLYREEARREGAPANRRSGHLASVALSGCRCE